jgi:hypothetical protein
MSRNGRALLTGCAVIFCFQWALAYATSGHAALGSHVARSAARTQCSQQELKRRDCSLTLAPYKVQLSHVKITWSDGTWTSIGDAPLSDEKFTWEKVNFQKMDGRFLLQFWIWDNGKGEAKVQSLHWVVLELKQKQLIAHLDQIVRKREVRGTEPVSYTYDRMIPHSIKKNKDGLQWTVEKNTGNI